MNTNNISQNNEIVKQPIPKSATLLDLFKDAPKFTGQELHESCPRHARKEKYLNFISSEPMLSTLQNTNLLVPLMHFLCDYNWTRRNFCKGRRSLEKKWNVCHRTVTKIFLCFYFMGIIERYGKWVFTSPKGHGYVPVWILTDKLFETTPEVIETWAKKFGFKWG